MHKYFLIGFTLFSIGIQDASAQESSSNRGQSAFDVIQDVEYGRAGDRPLKLDIYKPQEERDAPRPAIVWIHGGGWRGGDKASGRGRLAPLVRSGDYVGISIGYRLSGEAVWPAQIHDVKAAVRWIRANAEKHGIDPERIGLWGSSAGGHLVSLLGVSSDVESLAGENGTPDASSRVRCVVDFCGPADLTVFRHERLDQLFGTPYADRKEETKAASPIAHVTKDDPPFLVVHGTNDRTVPFSQAEMFVDKLKNTGVDVTFVRINGGGHGINGPEVMERVSSFFAKHLLGKEEVEVADVPIDQQKK